MNDPKKAFDPLASLFDGPNLRAIAAATALNAYGDDGLDSFLGASYPTEEAEDEGDAPSPVGEIGGWDQVLAALPPPPPSALRAATPRPIEAPPVVEAPPPVVAPVVAVAPEPAPEAAAEPTIADKLALARSLAQAAMARAKGIAAEPKAAPPAAAPPSTRPPSPAPARPPRLWGSRRPSTRRSWSFIRVSWRASTAPRLLRVSPRFLRRG